jgi:hypothetical protein
MKPRYKDGSEAVRAGRYDWSGGHVDMQEYGISIPLVSGDLDKGHAQLELTRTVVDNFRFCMGVVTALGYNWALPGSMSYEPRGKGMPTSVFDAFIDVYKQHPGTQSAQLIRQGGDMVRLYKDAKHEHRLAGCRMAMMLAVEAHTPPKLHRLVMNVLDRLEECTVIKDNTEFTALFGKDDMRNMAMYHGGLLLLDAHNGTPVACGPWALLMDW